MGIAFKLTMTLIMCGGFLTLLGIVVDSALGYGTKWATVVYVGLSAVGFGAVLGLAVFLNSLWQA